MLIELKNAVKSKVLFRTEDGVDIFEGDTYYLFNNGTYNKPWCNIAKEKTQLNIYHTAFSTKEAAEKYVLYNKPLLCINDFIDNNSIIITESKLKDLAQSRL